MPPLAKRLLHLGGAVFQVPAIRKARELGCEVIVADILDGVPGKEYATVFEPVSTVDVPGILAVAKRHAVDGIMTYASDSSTPTVALVAELLGLPGNPPAAARILQRKDLFRQFQREQGLPHPDFFVTDDLKEVQARLREMHFPIVLKPVDSGGTKGQSVVYSESEIPKAFSRALGHSKLGVVITESFVRSDLMELDGDVLVKDGALAFRHYGHNHFLKNRISNVPSGEIFPGFYGDEVTAPLDDQFRTIITALKLRLGCLNFDGLLSNGAAHILDIGLRSGGNFVPEAIEYSTGCDMTAAAIYAALGADYACPQLFSPDPRPVATYLIGSRFPGRLTSLEFGAQIKEYLLEYRPFVEPHNEVAQFSRSDMAVGVAFFRFPDMRTMRETMDQIEDLIDLRVTPTRSMQTLIQETEEDPHQVDPNAYKRFRELVSPFLRQKLEEAERKDDRVVVKVLTKQYLVSQEETEILANEGLRHYDASADAYFEGQKLAGVERLYRRVVLFEPLYQCIANCRFCLRRNYEPFNQNKDTIERIARYIGTAPGHEELREILITGGDPFLVPDKVRLFLDAVAEYAPQIAIARIATRVPIHQPDLVNHKLLEVLGATYPFRIEVATQVNHSAEMFPEVIDAYKRVLDTVRIVYNQTVLLRGVNDTKEELVELFDILREVGIENHYLFHCVPIGGLNHLRTSVRRSIDLARAASTAGAVSGRARPSLCFMTSVGKIIPYEGVILAHKSGRFLFKSDYRYDERMQWNPHWRLPADVEVTSDGYLSVWYEDAVGDDNYEENRESLTIPGAGR